MNLTLTVVMATILLVGIYRWSRHRSRNATEDPEIMRIRAAQIPQIYDAYIRSKAELLEILKEPLLIEAEEQLFSESVVWRRQYRADLSSENEEKSRFHSNNLRNLHSSWELNHPELAKVHERIGNMREALFILQYGTPDEVEKLMTDARALGSAKNS